MLVGIPAQIWFRVDRLQAHLPHESPHPLFVNDPRFTSERFGHLDHAIIRLLRIDCINPLGEYQIFRIYWSWLIIDTAPGDAQKISLHYKRYGILFVNVREHDIPNGLVISL